MYCNQCGYQNPDDSPFCASCGARLGSSSEVPQSAQYPWIGLIMITGGAIMMLVSMALEWYSIRDSIPISNLGFFDLLTERYSDLNYAGTGLPLFIIIVLASIVLISVLYSFASRELSKSLWIWLGSLCLLSLVGNYLYILVDMLNQDTGYYLVPLAGWIVAFIGALAVILGSGYAGRTISKSNPLV